MNNFRMGGFDASGEPYGVMIRIGPGLWMEHGVYDRDPTLEELRAAVEGDIEKVPYWDGILVNSKTLPCVVLCNEHGKEKGMEYNMLATLLWKQAQKAADVEIDDVLVGPVVILFGCPEFMRNL